MTQVAGKTAFMALAARERRRLRGPAATPGKPRPGRQDIHGRVAKVEQNLYRDDGSIKKENIAQIVNDQNFARIKKLFDDAVDKGAKVAVGGTLEEADRTIHPTMLTDVTPDMLIMQEGNLRAGRARNELQEHR